MQNDPSSKKMKTDTMVRGILYGVGTGPGDPELMTVKAVRVIRQADIIAVPTESAEESMAYRTASAACPEILGRTVLCLPFSMNADPAVRNQYRKKNAEKAAAFLDEGKTIAFLTIGDPTIYSTFGYLHEILGGAGYEISIVSGVPSFCGAAASLGIPLCCGEERLEIIPGAAYNTSVKAESDHRNISAATRVIMKPGKDYPNIAEELRLRGADARMIIHATLPKELQFHDPDHFPNETGYYSMIICKD